MKNNGFTLIELLGVIIILTLLLLIVVPSILENIKKGQEEADNNTKNSIILATKNWLTDNKDKVNKNSSYTVNVSVLQDEGYLPQDIKLPSKKCSLNNASVTITSKITEKNIKYNYKYNAPANCK